MERSTGLREKVSRTELSYIALWMYVNILDTLLTFTNLHFGGSEIWLVYHVTNSMIASTVVKYCSVVLIALVLMKYGKLTWLKWFIIGMIPVLAWNVKELVVFLC